MEEAKKMEPKEIILPQAVGEHVVQVKKSNVKKDKIALVGFAPSSLYEVNDLDETWEAMGMNELYKLGMKEMVPPNQKLLDLGKFTEWIEIHSRGFDKSGKAYCDDVNVNTPQGAAHIMNLNAMPFTVWMREVDMKKYNDVKNAKGFPFEKIVNFFGRKYFTNTVSWMLGLVLVRCFEACGIDTSKPCWEAVKGNYDKLKAWPYKKIGIWGVDMQVGWYQRSNGDAALQNEYASQRPSCEWVMGIVDGLRMAGVDVELIVPSKSALLKKYSLYGFEEIDPALSQMKIDGIERLDFLVKQEENLRNNINSMSAHFNAELGKLNTQLMVLRGNKAECEMQLSAID